MSNNEQNSFAGSEHFKIKVPKTELNKDIDVTITLQAKCKTYPVFYGETTVPGTQNYLLTFDPFGDVTGMAKLNVKTNTGKIKIVKNDVDTNQPIEGVTFQLTKQDVNVEYNQTNTQTIKNEHKKGNIKVYKIDKDNKKVVLGNVEFKLYSEEFNKIIGTYYTDVNGELEIKNLRTGNYKLIETKTNK